MAAVTVTLGAALAGPAPADSCWASWYGPGFAGRTTASGETFDPSAHTAAHRTLPFGTLLKASYQGRSVVVRVNDRGPMSSAYCIDLSQAAFEAIAHPGEGSVPVELVEFTPEPPPPPAPADGFHEYLTLYNPSDGPATATVRYLLQGRPPVVPAPLTVPARRRVTVDVAGVVGRGQEVSIEVLSDRPLVSERPMYFGDDRRTGGHVAPGQQPATEHYFPDGYTGEGFETYLVIGNPGDATTATVTYLIEGRTPVSRDVALPAQSRTTIDETLDLGRGVAASAVVSAAQPVVVERPMYFRYRDRIDGGHVTPGARAPSTTAVFAEGHEGDGFETYLVIMNPSGTSADVVAEVTSERGPVVRTIAVPAHSRATARLAEWGASGDLVIRLSSSVPFVAERSSYFDTDIPGVGRVTGGHVAVGPADGSTTWYFSEGHTGDGFREYLVVANPTEDDADVQVTFVDSNGTTTPTRVRVLSGSRRTIDVDAVVGPGRDVAAQVVSNVPVVAERPTYFRYQGAWGGGHSALGQTAPRAFAAFAEGYTG